MSTASTATQASNRNPSRGGIAKRRGPPVRTDRDGDLSMGGSAPTGPRGAQVGRGGGGQRGRGNKGLPTGPRRGVSGSGSGAGSLRTRTPRDPVGIVKGIVGGFVEIKISGWKESKGSDKECVIFLERKTGQKFRKTRTVGDNILVQVPLVKVPELLEWDNVQFASAPLRIAPVTDLPPSIQINGKSETERSEGATQASQILQEVLRTRYNAEAKLLNLGNLIADPILQQQGFFVNISTHTKLFPALMKVADNQFSGVTEKREKVHSISLEQNALADLTMVTTLAQTFPDLKNLSLGGNLFKEWKDLDPWRWKFRRLEQLVLIGCPITQLPGYREEARKRYPSLTMLDNEIYPTPPSLPATVGRQTRQNVDFLPPAPMIKLPVSIQPGIWSGGDITTQFLSRFFPGFDTDRKAIATEFYDDDSIFSLSVNTSAPRAPGVETTPHTWEDYIHKSRNMVKMHNPVALSRRLFTGVKSISDAWNLLPKSLHDSSDPSKWCYDSWTIPVGAVQGLWIVVHGEFEEVELVKKATGVTKRSFDRTFILSPKADGGIKVANDILGIRAWGGSEAWKIEDPTQVSTDATQSQTISGQIQVTTMPASASQVLQPQPTVLPAEPSDEIKKQMLFELMKRTNLTESYALMCLNQTGWNFDSALAAFQQVQSSGSLPADAFLS